MGERKVLNKHYPSDFDPSKIPRRRQPSKVVVRNMLPMTVRCRTCGAFIYKGTKFNMRMERAAGEVYLGEIQVCRFYFRCTTCSAEITFKTDPHNHDYALEESSGASRNHEPWREGEAAACNEKRKRDAEEMGDSMKALENRAKDSKQDMDILAALEETRSIKSRHDRVTPEQMLARLTRREEENENKTMAQLDREDEELIKSITFQNSEAYVKRIEDDDDDDDGDEEGSLVIPGQPSSTSSKITESQKSMENPIPRDVSKMPKFLVKPKSSAAPCPPKKHKTESVDAQDNDNMAVAQKEGETAQKTSILQSLCQIYENDEGDD